MTTSTAMPPSRTAGILIGFPTIATLISLLLLDRRSLDWTGLDFFTAFWLLITAWYIVQIIVLRRVLNSAGWTWRDIGYTLGMRGTGVAIALYLLAAFALVVFIELALASAAVDPARLQALSDLSNLTPKTLPQRIVFVLMGLAAGFAEELVYRGFAINALSRHGLHRWAALLVATVPFVFQHGLKSIDQFWWFFGWGIVLGTIYLLTRRLWIALAVHWLVILSALAAVLQVLQ